MELSHLQLPRGVGIGNWVIGNWELGIGNWESKIEYRLRVRNRVSINLWFSPTVSQQKPGFFPNIPLTKFELLLINYPVSSIQIVIISLIINSSLTKLLQFHHH